MNNENQVNSCPRTSNEVIITIKTSPQLVHSSSLYTGCLGAPISINSTGCSPYVTQWYDENENKIGTGAKIFVTHTDLNPKIYKATESFIGLKDLRPLLNQLIDSIDKYETDKILNILSQHVEGFER